MKELNHLEFKAARCPSCSGEISLDPSKEKGFCMHCGSEIIVEEAIQNLKIDGISSFDKLLLVAEELFNDKSYADAYAYFDKCYSLDPDNGFVLFGRTISKGYILGYEEVEEAFKVVNLVKRAFSKTPESEIDMLKEKGGVQLNNLAVHFYQRAKKKLEDQNANDKIALEKSKFDFISWAIASMYILEYSMKLKPESARIQLNVWGVSYYILTFLDKTKSYRIFNTKNLWSYSRFIKSIVPFEVLSDFDYNYHNPSVLMEKLNNKKQEFLTIWNDDDQRQDKIKLIDGDLTINKGACYIATAVYGDYDMRQVVTLRQYRDEVLLKSFFGRVFVKLYYIISPSIAKLLVGKDSINIFVRTALDYVVERIER